MFSPSSLKFLPVETPADLRARSTSSFHLPELVQVSMDQLVSGFHIKTSPSFKAKLGLIGLLNPERALSLADSFFFFPDGSRCLGGKPLKHTFIHQAQSGAEEKCDQVSEVFILD